MITHSDSLKQLAPALLAAQLKMGNAAKDASNNQLNNRYATIESVLLEVRDQLRAHGIIFTQHPYNDGARIGVETMLLHVDSCEWMRSGIAMETFPPHKGISPAQVAGSIITYLRKFSAAAIGGISQEDDDGQGGGKRGRDAKPDGAMRRDQSEQLRVLFDKLGSTPEEIKDLSKAVTGVLPAKLTIELADKLLRSLEARLGEDEGQ